MPRLLIFRDAFTENMRRAVPSNLAKYRLDDPWIEEIGTMSSRQIETAVEIGGPLTLSPPTNAATNDFENSVRIHKALGRLTPLQACDRRLWTRLSHVELW